MRKWIVTFFGAGLSPVAPGTVGSAAAAILLWVAYQLAGRPVFWAWQVMLLIGLGAASLMCVGLGPWAQAYFGRKDAQPIVLDEVAGICLTALFTPMAGNGWLTLLVVFAAFRLFDVTKPPPARQLEKLPLGWGVLCDDLAAAVYANLVCQLVLRIG